MTSEPVENISGSVESGVSAIGSAASTSRCFSSPPVVAVMAALGGLELSSRPSMQTTVTVSKVQSIFDYPNIPYSNFPSVKPD